MALRRMVRGGRWRVAPGSPDIRGWRLFDVEGAKAGVVGGLLFDDDDRRVRQAIVDLWEKRVLVPVSLIDARPDRREAVIRGYTLGSLLALDPYRDEDYEADAIASTMWSLLAGRAS